MKKIYCIYGKVDKNASNYWLAMTTTRKYIAKAWLEYWQSKERCFYYMVEDDDFDILPSDRPF